MIPRLIRKRLDRIEARVGRALVRSAPLLEPLLPDRLTREVDGLRLHPEMQMLLALRERLGAPRLTAQTPREARAHASRDARVHAGPRASVQRTANLVIEGPGGPLKLRHYAPAQPGLPCPLLVYLHGGGFVLGDIDTHDSVCRVLCRTGRVHVLSVDYRLAPEHRMPAAVDDAWAAFLWARERATSLGADPARVLVGGDSAGGNLATVLCQRAKQLGVPQPALQVLIYPTVDRTRVRRSIELFAQGYFLERTDMDWYTNHYTGGEHPLSDLRISPLLAPDLSGLSPALVVTAGFDPLRDEGEEYARALEAAGNAVRFRREPDLIHGFINMGGPSSRAAAALEQLATDMAVLLASAC